MSIMAHHAEPHDGSPIRAGHEARAVAGGKHGPRPLPGSSREKQGRWHRTGRWLVGITPVGFGAENLSSVFWYLALG